jgi:Protein of unknown function (DUF3160)
MKTAKFFTVLIVFLSVIAGGCLVPPGIVQPGELPTPVQPGELANPKLAIASTYKPTPVSFTPSSPAYSLPLDLSKITNSDQIKNAFNLNPDQEALLHENSFVVIPWRGSDIVQPYLTLKDMEIPIFVTSDTLLHLYHIQFNEILRRIEEEDFYNQLIDMTQAMLKTAEADYQSFTEPALKEAARRNVAYFAVALSLLQTPSNTINFDVPSYVKNEVSQEINNVEAHQGFSPSSIFNTDADCRCDMMPCYCEDYSQYVPRGHYTRSEILKSYFKSMMWYGRMAFLLKGGLVSEEDAKIATIQASLIATELPDVKVADYTAKDVWDRIYAVTSFFVGTADDLTPYEYLNTLNKVFGQEFAVNQLTDEAKMLTVKAELAAMRNPEIYGGSGVCVIYPPITKDKLYECLSDTKGMRFMGQRFVPDSYMFQNLVTPAVGMYVGKNNPFTMCMTMLGPARCFPRGLDVMTVLGSDRAYQILLQEGDTEYRGTDTSYDKQLAQLKDEFTAFTENDWHRNLYWSWLYALKPLVEKYGKGYPAFMQTDVWQEKELNTSLASWAELRHDTILYAKQSYTPMVTSAPPPPSPPKPVVGYIEPVPDFYARMLNLTKMTREGLSQLGALSSEENGRLLSLEAVLNTSLSIAVNEVEGKKLTDDDYDFIREFGSRLENIITGVEAEGKETTVVADVHTDTNTAQVLEEGVGYVDLILVAYKVPDGRIIIGAGPTLSYYEFKQPIDNRLTDEQWKQMLLSDQAPSRPAWTGSFFQP